MEGSEKSTKKSISGNVKRLRFMQISNNELARKNDKKLSSNFEWILNREEFDKVESLPLTFFESHYVERVTLASQHRRSYKGFNPTVENFQKQIAVKLAGQKRQAEVDEEIELLAKAKK